MGKYIGPKSDPEGKGHKLLCIDGYINYFSEEMEEYVDTGLLNRMVMEHQIYKSR